MRRELFVGLSVLVFGCGPGKNAASSDPPRVPTREFFVGVFETADVAGRVLEVDDTVPRDGGRLILRLQDRHGDVVTVSVRGHSEGYEPTDQEKELYLGALRVQEGDWIEVELSNGSVSGLHVIQR